MKNILSRIAAAIKNQSVAGLGNIFPFCHDIRDGDHFSDQRLVFRLNIADFRDMPFRNDEKMDRGAWMNVPKGDDLVRFI